MDLYHTLNRGVDKRVIFMDDQDRFRFVHDLFEFNDSDWVNTTTRIFAKLHDIASRTVERKKRKLIVDIHAFCIMPNHYHLLLSPRVHGGITLFMKKLNMGYAKYFNERYKRTGALFEGRYKSVLVENQAHFNYLPYYIHFNPLDMATPEWRERRIKDYEKTINFLNFYRWSSHLDYIGKRNFPSITNRKFLLDYFDGNQGYESQIKIFLKEMNLEDIKPLLLE